MSIPDPTAAPRAVGGFRAVLVPTRWKVWAEPPRFLIYLFGVQAAALGLTVVLAVALPPSPRDGIILVVLAGLGVLQAEFGRPVERLRRLVDRAPHINLTSVWTFAGVMLLPPAMTALLVGVLYLHLAVRSWRRLPAAPVYRTVANICLATLTCHAAYGVLIWLGLGDIYTAVELGWGSVGAIALAILTYFVTAAVIALPGLRLAEGTLADLIRLKPLPRVLKQLFGGWVDNTLEVATLWTGALVAFILISRTPFLVVAVVLLLYYVHRGVLLLQLDALAELDKTTGLFSTIGFHTVAIETLNRAKREHGRGAVLMMELDRYQEIRDRYGYVVADEVLTAIAETLRANVGDHDAVGRFAGAEFVILLPDLTEDEALQVANDLRKAILGQRVPIVNLLNRTEVIRALEVSIGVAAYRYPSAGFSLHKILAAANTALNLAKLRIGQSPVQLANTA